MKLFRPEKLLQAVLFAPHHHRAPLGSIHRTCPRIGELGYGPVEGLPRLRRLIAAYAARAHGLPLRPDQVIITVGADQAFDLLLRALSPIHQVIVEASGSEPVNRLLQLVKIQSVPVAVDRKGLCVEKSNAVILEDDYDSEFRFDRQPPIALAALDSLQRAAYAGTFSKTMFSGLRLGYCILPEHLIPGVLDLKWFSDRCVPVVEQLALADWLESGMLERHIRKMRTIYAKRRGVLTAKLYEHFGHLVQVLGVSAGMHVLVSVL